MSSSVLPTRPLRLLPQLMKMDIRLQRGLSMRSQKRSVSKHQAYHKSGSIYESDTLSQISLGVSTTQLLHNLSTALKFQPGDELIVSKLNHEANSAPWARIAERLGLTVKWWASSDPKNPTCDVADLKTLLSDKTRLVACPHASNITGTISPIREIADAVHAHPRVSVSVVSYDITKHIHSQKGICTNS